MALERKDAVGDASTTAVCEVTIADDSGYAHTYSLHASLYELTSVRLFTPVDGDPVDLALVSRDWLNKNKPTWREDDYEPEFAIQNDRTLRIVPPPNADGLLKLEGYRLPLVEMDEDTDTPEIGGAHHRHLVQWVLHKVFGIPDADHYDAEKSAKALAEFERYFGPPVDADLRRSTRHDVEHHNVAILP